MHVIGAYTLKREACVSTQTAVFSKRKVVLHLLHFRQPSLPV